LASLRTIKKEEIYLKSLLKNMPKDNHPDYILLGAVIILIVLGILALASASALTSLDRFGTPYYFLTHQIYGLILGIILAFLAFKISLFDFKKWAPRLLFLNLILMALVFVPSLGGSFWGASRWISLGPISFQPSEFLKITFFIYLAAWLSRVDYLTPNSNIKKTWRTKVKRFNFSNLTLGLTDRFIPFLIIIGVIGSFLIAQPDISTLGIITLVAILIYFSAGGPIFHSVLIVSLSLASLFVLVNIAPYRINRLLVFLNPDIDPMGIGYQVKQALIAIGSGGIFGLGLGMGVQKLGFLPQPMSDAIFAVFVEETGFIGSLILIIAFLIFFWRGIEIAKRAKDKFSKLLALGVSCWIIIQALTNIGAMVGILPLTGIPLPFISYGGSALVAELIGVGILLNISKSV
tara:strand:- start:1881 stop:3098 length:1218 start_codon:yes stop_codon:yes gene_type:complete